MNGGPDAGSDPGEPGVLAEPVAQSGVAYVAHYLAAPDSQNKLMWFRTDGATPTLGGSLDLGAPTQDMTLDARNDVLAVLSDVGHRATLYHVSRPASVDSPIAAPEKAGVIDFDSGVTPVSLFFNDVRQRLYVVVSSGGGGTMQLYGYDVSDPDVPATLGGFPVEVPLSAYHAVDSSRNLLFLAGMSDKKLHVYDLDDSGLRELPGEPLDLPALYPEPLEMPSPVAFQVRHTTVDPWRNRVYATRAQGILSELIAFDYPDTLPASNERYGDTVSMSEFKLVRDAFDTSLPGTERPNLLGGYGLGLDPDSGDLFMAADAWNGNAATAIVTGFRGDDLSLAPGCSEFEDFGCFYRDYSDSTAGDYPLTDGALCFDAKNDVVVGTSLAQSEENPGLMHFFKVAGDGTMESWLDAEGSTLRASSYPLAAVCH